MSASRHMVALVTLALATGCAGARDTRPPPRVRVDVDVHFPGAFVPLGVGVRGGLSAGAGLRVVTRLGLGGAVSVTGSGDLRLITPPTSVVTARAEGWLVDMAATWRLRPFGNDRRGLGIDLSLGATLAGINWEPGSSAYDHSCGIIALSCDAVVVIPYVSPPQAFTAGRRVGPLVSVGVDLREGAFVFGVAATYRALVYDGLLAPIAAEPAALQVLTVFSHVGFGFSL
jgi:hypothetical protein